jgi:hypothetical protein
MERCDWWLILLLKSLPTAITHRSVRQITLVAADEVIKPILIQNTFQKPVAGIHSLYAVWVPDGFGRSCGDK